MNPLMKVEAICPKEIVISSGSGQEKKLREMRVNPDDLFKYPFPQAFVGVLRFVPYLRIALQGVHRRAYSHG